MSELSEFRERVDEQFDRLHSKVNEIAGSFREFRGALRVNCANHNRRLTQLEKQAGNRSGRAGFDARFWGLLAASLVALATAIAAIVGVH